MDKLYKITNDAKTKDGVEVPLHLDWNTSLLDDDNLEKWHTYRNNIRLSEMSPEQATQFKKTPEAIKLAIWATNNGIGEIMPGDPLKPRMNGFKLKPGVTYGFNERQANSLKYLTKKVIEAKLKPGQVTPDKYVEGFLTIEVMTPQDHMAWEKQKAGIVDQPKAEVEGFKCETCGKVCSSKAALIGHKRSHK